MGEDEGLKKRGIIDFLPLKREGLLEGGAFFDREALKVIRWFCTAHLLLRTTRWLLSKRSSKVTLLK